MKYFFVLTVFYFFSCSVFAQTEQDPNTWHQIGSTPKPLGILMEDWIDTTSNNIIYTVQGRFDNGWITIQQCTTLEEAWKICKQAEDWMNSNPNYVRRKVYYQSWRKVNWIPIEIKDYSK